MESVRVISGYAWKVSSSSFWRSKTGTNYYDPNEVDYRSQGYPQHDVGTSYYNAAPVFLRQPVRPLLASYCKNSSFTFCRSSTIFSTRLLSPQNSSGILKARTLSPLLLISVKLSKSAVKPFEVSPTPILGCRRSYKGTTRSFHLNLQALQTERNLEIGIPQCIGRSGQRMGSRTFFEGSRVSLFLSPPIPSRFFSSF